MTLESLKREYSRRTMQLARLNRDGLLLESDHTLLNLTEFIGKPVLQAFPLFMGLEESILQLTADDSPLPLPLVSFEHQGKIHLVTIEFHARPEEIIWLIFDNQDFLPRLRNMQQQRNESLLLLEKIRQQEIELRHFNQQLQLANAELDRFAYIISHDLKTPLRGIRNLASWIAEDLQDGQLESARQQLEILQGRGERMQKLIEAVLSYSRAGREAQDAVQVDTQALVQQILDDHDARTQLEFVGPEPMPVLVSVEAHLQQVFANLVSNALKYGPEGGSIRIGAESISEGYRFSVADQGPGIPAEDRARVFEIFETLGAEANYENTGIGLTIVQKLVRQHGGDIEIDDAPGGGARFSFTWH